MRVALSPLSSFAVLQKRNLKLLLLLAQVFKDYPTAITPNPYVLGLYVLALNLGQVGYCILLVLAKKPETKVSTLLLCTHLCSNEEMYCLIHLGYTDKRRGDDYCDRQFHNDLVDDYLGAQCLHAYSIWCI